MTVVLFGAIVSLFFLYLNTHTAKSRSKITSFESAVEDYSMFDLHAGKQILSLEYYHFVDVFIEYEKYIRVEFSHVTEIPKKGIFTRKPLNSVACKDVEFLKNDPNLIWLSHCLQFSEKTEIGFNPSTGEKKSI